MARIERQELHCHECNGYVQFDIDLEIEGNHVLECPKCGHEHCRVVQKGKISETRWDTRNMQGVDNKGKPIPAGSLSIKGVSDVVFPPEMIGPNGLPIIKVSANTLTWSNQSTYAIYEKKGNGSVYLYMAWTNVGL
jgi:hypothetical protein